MIEAVKEKALLDFHRTAIVTQAIQRAAIEVNALFPDREEVPFHIMVYRVRQLTGLRLSEGYIEEAIDIYRSTGRFVEQEQLRDNATEH